MPDKYNPIKRLSFVLIASIFLGELLIMLIFPFFGQLHAIAGVLLNVLLLSLITIPAVKFMMIRPAKKYIHDLESAQNTIQVRENQMLGALNALANAKDNATGGHIIRTQQYVRLLAQRVKSMGHHLQTLTDEHIEKLHKVAPLHDIGKVGIPDQILKKMGPLTADEREVMKQHSLIGESILLAAQLEEIEPDLLTTALKIAGCHHEKWDGTGYPRGLSGESIPIEARIMAVADVFESLSSDRPYKKAWTFKESYELIVKGSGTAFDPVVVEAFIAEREGFEDLAKKH